MVDIVKRRLADGYRYEIDDLDRYVAELSAQGISPPPAAYRVFVTYEDEALYQQTHGELDEQIARFFGIGPHMDISYHVRQSESK